MRLEKPDPAPFMAAAGMATNSILGPEKEAAGMELAQKAVVVPDMAVLEWERKNAAVVAADFLTLVQVVASKVPLAHPVLPV